MSYRISPMEGSSVFGLYLDKETIWIDPPYQRLPGIWSTEKKQLLIDSLLNGFDVPKFYLHDFYPGTSPESKDHRFAIIDGKQRLTTIWDYIDGKFPLSDDIELLNDPDTDLRGLTYGELEQEHPRLKATFDSRQLSVVTIQTEDTELIEEMFSRLNEAVPLSAAEKRNALRGLIPPIIRELAEHPFFRECLPFGNTRYRHFDLVTKFLYLTDERKIVDLKKQYLDAFVIRYRDESLEDRATKLKKSVTTVLNRLNKTFTDGDWLLCSVGTVTLYYVLKAGLAGARMVRKSIARGLSGSRICARRIAGSRLRVTMSLRPDMTCSNMTGLRRAQTMDRRLIFALRYCGST